MARENKTLTLCLLVISVAILIGALAADPAGAISTFTVNRTTNESDASTADGVCDSDGATAGNQCTLKAAIQQANANANPAEADAINFNIPGDPTKVKSIRPTSELPAITQSVTINGYSQPGSSQNTRAKGAINAALKVQLDGSQAGIDADGLIIQGVSNVTIRGLVINRFDRSGIFLTSTDNSDNNRFEGNFIGTNAAGTTAFGNGNAGVEINGLNNGNVVGGSAPEQRNLISGNQGDGVFAGTDGTDTIQGNLIGTDKTGTADIHNGTDNNGEGVNLGGQNSVVVDNIIAFNTSDGVQVRSNATGTGHDIGPNSIFSNDGLGIDIVDNANSGLGPNGDGPNTNDGGTANDADTGPNDLQNFPTITSAKTSSSTDATTIDAFLDTVPSTQYLIRFYSNPQDTGEGKTFIGDTTVTTNANGTFSVNDFVTTKTVPVGQSITATATKSLAPRNTSEFSGEPRSVRPAP
ncbi:MAG TPA: right-handed parallel beta-helix repeat-containing protein [Rubrobacter sp.]|nr:right-handed parallel beta-helix repeat-containing protein [Rubrobacter sp.]